MISEFKKFILRGNVIDLAVGVIIGGAFNKIVTSVVNDILTPILSIFTNNVKFENLKIPLNKFMDQPATINIGAFITSVLDFLITAIVIFAIVKLINTFLDKTNKKNEEPKQVSTKKCDYCFTEIHINATRCPNCTSILADKNS